MKTRMSTTTTLTDERNVSERGNSNGEIMMQSLHGNWAHDRGRGRSNDCQYYRYSYEDHHSHQRDHSELFPWGAGDDRHFDENNYRRQTDRHEGNIDGRDPREDPDPSDEKCYINYHCKPEWNSHERKGSADRDADIDWKLKLLNQELEWSPESGKSFNRFYSDFLFHYKDFLGLTELDLRYCFINCLTDDDMRTHIQEMTRFSPEISLNEIAAKIASLYTNESHLYYQNKLETFRRKSRETINSLSFRLRCLYDDSINPSELFLIKDTAFYEQNLLFYFYRALNNPELVRELNRRGVKTLDSAVLAANTLIQAERSAQICKVDTHDSKLPVLTIEMEAALLSGEVIRDNHLNIRDADESELKDTGKASHAKTVQSMTIPHSPRSNKRPKPTCFNCQLKGHYANKCTLAKTEKPIGLKSVMSKHTQPSTASIISQHTPLQERNMEQLRRERNRHLAACVNMIKVEQEEESEEEFFYEEESEEEFFYEEESDEDVEEDVNEISRPEDKLTESLNKPVNSLEVRKQESLSTTDRPTSPKDTWVKVAVSSMLDVHPSRGAEAKIDAVSSHGVNDEVTAKGGMKLGPEGPKLGPEEAKLGPEGAKLGQEGAKLGPGGAELGPDRSKIGPDGLKLGPDGPKLGPDGLKLKPDGPKIEPDSSITDPQRLMISQSGFKERDSPHSLKVNDRLSKDNPILPNKLVKTGSSKQNFPPKAKIQLGQDSKHELMSMATDARFSRIKNLVLKVTKDNNSGSKDEYLGMEYEFAEDDNSANLEGSWTMDMELKAQMTTSFAKALVMQRFEQDSVFNEDWAIKARSAQCA